VTVTRLASVRLHGDADAWRALGLVGAATGRFAFANGTIDVGDHAPSLAIAGPLELPAHVDGVVVAIGDVTAPREHPSEHPSEHPNGAFELDHIVVTTDSLERTSAAFEHGLGLVQRRVRETPTVRQAFHRFADQGGSRGCIVEVVESARVDGATIWGVVLNVVDLDRLTAAAGELLGALRPAVQPGRQIATVRREAGLSVAVAFMSV
jgi:hypothetical protein